MDVLFVSSKAQKHHFNNSIIQILLDINTQIVNTSHIIIFVMSQKDRKHLFVRVGMAESDNSRESSVADSESDDSQSTSLSSVGDEELLLTSGPSEILPYRFEPVYESRLEDTGESSGVSARVETEDTEDDRVGNTEW